MSELNNTATAAAKMRKAFLATASAFVLAAYCDIAHAVENSRPTVWIEGGWHFEGINGDSDQFAPPLEGSTRAAGFTSLPALENALGRTYGGEGSISFQPDGSDWVFAAAARYGRVQTTHRFVNQKTIVGPNMTAGGDVVVPPTFHAYAIGYSKNSESHAIVDFQVGKDIGIGLLGRGTDSIISFGARYAQMSSKSKAHSYAQPDATFEHYTSFGKYFFGKAYQRSAAFVDRADTLHAFGPSFSVKNATGLLGTVDDGQLGFDWGVNAAVLFGRQKAEVSHHSSVKHFYGLGIGVPVMTHVYAPATRSRSRMVTVPNVGGFAGLSYRIRSAKFAAGYRADFFFAARDVGIDTRSTANVGFHGPFATVSIGFP